MAKLQTTFDITTNIGKVRSNIGDTDLARPWFYDEEINEFLSRGGSDINLSTYYALNALANRAALAATRLSAAGGSLVVDKTKLASELRAQAKVFYERAKAAPYTATQEFEDTTLEVRDAWKNKWIEDFTDTPSDS